MNVVRVLLVQATPVPHDVEANTATVLRLLADHPEADLAVFPELFLHGYTLPGIDRIAVGLDDGPVAAIRAEAARVGTGVVLGLAERLGAAALPGNSAVCIDPDGSAAGTYRKVHLFGEEADWFTRGDSYPVVPLLGRPTGLLICYDIEFPEAARAIALAGAELLVTISANMDPFAHVHALFGRARALENRLAHVYVNRTGPESGFDFVGGSLVADADGTVVVELGRDEEVRLVDVPVGRPAGSPLPDYLADRHPDVGAVTVARGAG